MLNHIAFGGAVGAQGVAQVLHVEQHGREEEDGQADGHGALAWCDEEHKGGAQKRNGHDEADEAAAQPLPQAPDERYHHVEEQAGGHRAQQRGHSEHGRLARHGERLASQRAHGLGQHLLRGLARLGGAEGREGVERVEGPAGAGAAGSRAGAVPGRPYVGGAAGRGARARSLAERRALASREGPAGERVLAGRSGRAGTAGMRVRVVGIGTRVAAGVELGGPRAVQQHVAGLVDALRELLGLGALRRVQGELVRVMRDHQLAMGLLDIVIGGAVGQPQGFERFGFLHGVTIQNGNGKARGEAGALPSCQTRNTSYGTGMPEADSPRRFFKFGPPTDFSAQFLPVLCMLGALAGAFASSAFSRSGKTPPTEGTAIVPRTPPSAEIW